MSHACPECGMEHEGAVVAPEPVPVPVETGPNEHDVTIAQIQADTEVKVAKISAGAVEDDLRGEVESLRGEVRGMREILERVAPPPAPEPPAPPVVVEPPAPEPDMAPPPAEPSHPRAPKPKRGFF